MALPLAVIDSGIGGLPYLTAARDALPGRTFVYAADTAHFPYGEKGEDGIRDAVVMLVERLMRHLVPAAVVVACNTASVVALDELRNTFDLPFVGVVPAVKPAAATSEAHRIGVLATPRTAGGPYLQALIERFAANAEVVVEAAPDLVDFIENRMLQAEASERRDALERSVRRLIDARVDRIVLGCTHFIHLRREIEELVGPSVNVVDSVDGVTRQLLRVLGERPGEAAAPVSHPLDESPGDALFVTSAEAAPVHYAEWARRCGLRYAGELPLRGAGPVGRVAGSGRRADGSPEPGAAPRTGEAGSEAV